MITKLKNIISKKRFWIGILLVQFFLFYFLSKWNFAILIFEKLFEFKKEYHQIVFSKIPFSFGDVFYVGVSLLILYFIASIFNKNRRNKSSLQLLIFINVFYTIYQILWGMLYFQEPLINKLPKAEININEAKTLSVKYLISCKNLRENLNENYEGVFYIQNIENIEKSILKNQKNIPLQFSNKKTTNIENFKNSIFGSLMSYTGIFGYYNPFTSEAQYNKHLPSSYLAFTLAHESSHQLGFAREQEANFIGFLIGQNSENKELQYSTDLFALKSLLRYIAVEDPKFVENILTNYSTKMKQDRKAEKYFEEKHRGLLDQLFAISNNLFLKSNQQDGSISYSYFTELLIKYERIK